MIPSIRDLKVFRKNNSFHYDTNILRLLLLYFFYHTCLPHLTLPSIAVVGGSLGDQELHLLKQKFPQMDVTFYGISHDDTFLNLNDEVKLSKQHDLVICTNVLEHVYQHENFAKNIHSLLKFNGLLWLAFPFSDMFHGSPDFYSAGFHPSYSTHLLERHSFDVLETGHFGSNRSYLATHFLQDWPGEFRYSHPVIGHLLSSFGLLSNPRPPIRTLFTGKWGRRVFLSLQYKKFSDDPKIACSSWVLAKSV